VQPGELGLAKLGEVAEIADPGVRQRAARRGGKKRECRHR
jgi:hypothetical protein